MKRKITLLLTLIISLSLFAQERMENRKSGISLQKTTLQSIRNITKPARVINANSILLSEGFDAAFLPSGWTQQILNNSYTWIQSNPESSVLNFNTIDPSSLYSAMVPWVAATQSEWLYTPQINPAGMSTVELQFYAGVSGGWLSNATLKCLISTDDGGSWNILWDAIDHIAYEETWAWHLVTINLNSYTSNQFKIAWLYVGNDGDLVGLDGVIITAEQAASVNADFSANQTNITTGQSVQFTNNSTGSTSWNWEFEGGTPSTSTLQNPSVTYNTAGTFNVKLTAKNGSVEDVKLKSNYITVSTEISANFSANQTSITTGQSVQFTNSSTGSTSWDWEFEGGTPSISTLQNPSVTYNTVGTYDVKLTAKNGTNTDTEVKTNYIIVSSSGGELAVEVTSDPGTTICKHESTLLTAIPSGGTGSYLYVWTWDIDGQVVTTNYFRINDLAISTRVYLTVTSGSQEFSKTIEITVNEKPEASIMGKGTPNTILICPYPDLEYSWFHNSTLLNNEQKQFYYPGAGNSLSGTYYVTTTNSYGCSSNSENYIIATDKTTFFNSDDDIISVYPNPSNGIFHIGINPELILDNINDYRIVIYSISGSIIWQSLYNTSFSLQIKPNIRLAPGSYILKLYGDNTLFDTQKIIVN